MPDSTLNRRSVALYVAKPTQLSYPQKTAECLLSCSQFWHLSIRSLRGATQGKTCDQKKWILG